jgi:protocatechuate 3,4-dioxygenase beta subunit
MRQIIRVFICGLLFFSLRGNAIEIGDELPAFEPLHLVGLHEGTRICPMCAYGYESGLVVFVSSSLAAAQVQKLKQAIEPAALAIQSKQFRVFVIVVGEASATLVSALRVNDPRWFIATLTGSQLRKAEKDFGRSLSAQSWGYAFSHRKLLRELSGDQLYGEQVHQVRLAATDALQTFEQAEFAATEHRVTQSERIVGPPCEGCDLVFAEMPNQIGPRTRIAAEAEPGHALRLSGHVIDRQSRPVAGVIVYAYHTNEAGRYPRGSAAAKFHGRLRGWAQSDAQGFYEFVTIRPGGYPGRPDPAHIHMHIIEPGRCSYYIDNVVFADDARLTERHVGSRAGSGKVTPQKNFKGVWHATREIYLGRDIPGYELCGT